MLWTLYLSCKILRPMLLIPSLEPVSVCSVKRNILAPANFSISFQDVSGFKYICGVTNCNLSPNELGYKLNEPNTINL